MEEDASSTKALESAEVDDKGEERAAEGVVDVGGEDAATDEMERGEEDAEVGEEDAEVGEEGEEGEYEGEEGEEGDLDMEDLYSRPVDELVGFCKELEIDSSGSQYELATRILDELEKRDEQEVLEAQAAETRLVPSADDESGESPRGPRPRMREPGSMRNERLRGSLSWEERVQEAEEIKEAANKHFQAGANEVALAAYLAAVWLLKPAR